MKDKSTTLTNLFYTVLNFKVIIHLEFLMKVNFHRDNKLLLIILQN